MTSQINRKRVITVVGNCLSSVLPGMPRLPTTMQKNHWWIGRVTPGVGSDLDSVVRRKAQFVVYARSFFMII